MDPATTPCHAPQPPPSSRPDSYANSDLRKFPPELKLEVLTHLQDEPKDADQPGPAVPTRVAVMSVCKDLKELVHSSPDMWATLPLQNRDMLEVGIRNSRDRPLTFHAFPPDVPPSGVDAHKGVLNRAWDYINRANCLFMGANEDHTAFIERAPAPKLVMLNAKGGSATAQAFHGEIPSNLRVLKLEEYRLASNSPIFASPQLSDITFIRCRSTLSSDAQSELAKILECVQSSVKNLVVKDSGLSLVERGDDDADPVPIHLPNIELLHVVDELLVLASTLSSLSVPRNAKVEIIADDTDSPEAYLDQAQQVRAWIGNHLAGLRDAGAAMGSLTIHVAADGGTTFIFSRSPATAFQQAPTGAETALPEALTFTARFVWPTGPETATADEDEEDSTTGIGEEAQMTAAGAPMRIGGVVVYIAMGSGIGDYPASSSTFNIPHAFQKEDVDWLRHLFSRTLSDVRELNVAHPVLHTVDGWITTSLHCIRVEEIIVSGPAAYGLVTLLGQTGGREKFPALSVLSIRGVTFTRRKTVWGRGVTFVQRLVYCLDMRTPASVRVSVRECVVEGGSIERLRASSAVLTVEWDEVVA